jgi:hypothetical protein
MKREEDNFYLPDRAIAERMCARRVVVMLYATLLTRNYSESVSELALRPL